MAILCIDKSDVNDLPKVCMQCGQTADHITCKTFSRHPFWVVPAPFCGKHKNHWSKRDLPISLPLFGLVLITLIVSCMPRTRETKRGVALHNVRVLNNAARIFEDRHNRPPNNPQELLVEVGGKPAVLLEEGTLIDPWGIPYVFDGHKFHCESLKDHPEPLWDDKAVLDGVCFGSAVLTLIWTIVATVVYANSIRAVKISEGCITLMNVAPEFVRACVNCRPADGQSEPDRR